MTEFWEFSPPQLEKEHVIFQVIGFVLYVGLFLFANTIIFAIRSVWMSAKRLKGWYISMKSMKFRGFFATMGRTKRIFIFGSPHAGKSTLLGCLIHFLTNSTEHTLRRDPEKNPEGVKIIRQLMGALDAGQFPMQTPAGFWQKVQIEYHKSNTPEKRDFCFQEVAGETSELFDPTNDRHHALSEEMKGFLLDSNGVLIVASAKPDSTSEKEVINDFLELLYRSSYDRPILFLLTKFDEVSANFANEVEAAKSIYTNAIGLLSQDSKSSLLPFSIGTVIDGQIAQNMSGTHIPPLLEWMEGI